MAKYKLTHYNIILDNELGGAIPMDELNGDYQSYLQWLNEDPSNIPDPADPKFEDTWAYIRERRSSLLIQCDWTQLSDCPLTSEKKALWTEYRQALRDLPGSFATPADVVWPTPPN